MGSCGPRREAGRAMANLLTSAPKENKDVPARRRLGFRLTSPPVVAVQAARITQFETEIPAFADTDALSKLMQSKGGVVTALLHEHRDQLDALAQRLIEHETLDEADAYAAAGIDHPDDESASRSLEKRSLK